MRVCRRRPEAGFDPSTFAGFEDVFGGIFGDFFGGGRRGGPERGSDLRYDLEITFEESAKGVETTVDIPRLETCDTCHGSGAAPGTSPTTCPQCQGRGTAAIPAGIFHGRADVLPLPGHGPHRREAVRHVQRSRDARPKSGSSRSRFRRVSPTASGSASAVRVRAGAQSGPSGDLYVFIEVAPHPFFRRDGNNLACEIPLNFTTLALGGSIDVPTLDGTESFKVPEGTQSGSVFRLRGKGMPDVSGRGRGDLFFTVQAVTPKKLNKEQRAALEQLGRTLPKEKFEPVARNAEEDEKNLFEKVKDIFG